VQYLKDSSIPIICTGVYSKKVFGGMNRPNTYATCYASKISEQVENTILKINPNLKRLGLMYKIGEMQSDVQHDELKEFCKEKGITLESFDIQSEADFESAAKFFTKKKVEWVFLGADTVVANASSKELEVFTSKVPTLCVIGNTVANGGLIAYHSSWKHVAIDAADVAINLFNEKEVNEKCIVPKYKQILVNRKTAETLGLLDKLQTLGEIRFID
jgi:ABC-type uncharacterized transport system substrate-binding protein